MTSFPPLRLAVLTGLLGLKDHVDTLDNDDCPYDSDTKGALKKLLAPVVVEKVVEKEVVVGGAGRGRPSKDIKLGEDDQRMVLEEIKATLANLKTLEAGAGADTNARIQIAKTKTDLLEKLMKMMERHTTVSKMEDFKERVIAILNDLVSEKDRDTFLRRIDAFR